MCHDYLLLIDDGKLYAGETACCDECGNVLSKKQTFFHCPDEQGMHPNGYDICIKCLLVEKPRIESTFNQQQKESTNSNAYVASRPIGIGAKPVTLTAPGKKQSV